MSAERENIVHGDMSTSRTDCRECKHLIIWPYCLAFLTGSGIPSEILEGRIDHSAPFPGDRGIRFLHRDSPYEMSETALKGVIAMYVGETVMPDIGKPSGELQAGDSLQVPKNAAFKKAPADLMEACISGNVEAAKEFLARGADINSRDVHGNTPLMHACRGCHLEIVKMLLERGCDATAVDRYSKQAIDIAKDWGYPTIVDFLDEYIADKE